MLNNQVHRSSLLSQTSRLFVPAVYITDSLTDFELVKYVNDLKEEIRLLKLENEILENTIKRLEPALMHGVYQALEYATRADRSSLTNISVTSKSQTSRFGLGDTLVGSARSLTSPRLSTRKSSAMLGTSVIYGLGPKINMSELLELLSVEVGVQAENVKNIKNAANKKQVLLKAQLEEIDIRVSDIDKARELFKQEVLIDGVDKITQRIPAETWIRFMSEWVKRCDTQIGKLRLRTSTLNTQYRKFKGQIKLKADLSKSLRPVDFEKMSIENSECMKLIDRKVHQIEELKTLTGDANLNLVVHKKALMDQNSYLAKVIQTRKMKEKQIEKINKEHGAIQMQADNLSQELDEIRELRTNYMIPDVMDYVKVKFNINDLKRDIKVLQNKIHLHEIGLTTIGKRPKPVRPVAEPETVDSTRTTTNLSTYRTQY